MATDQLTFTDTLLTCEECDLEFIWTVTQQRRQSEQGTAPQPPARCPACERLAAPAGMTRGRVKWYNRTKGWGFITLAGGDELFVHRTGLADGLPGLQDGDLVEFTIEKTAKGPQAVDVRRLAVDEPSPEEAWLDPASAVDLS